MKAAFAHQADIKISCIGPIIGENLADQPVCMKSPKERLSINRNTVAVSILYIFAAISTIISMVGNQQAVAAIIESNETVLDSMLLWNLDFWMVGMSALMVLGMVLSLYFMRYSMMRGT